MSGGFCFLHPNGLFSVYYLGVYMIFGVYILLFSVSATLKVCIYIIAHKNLMSIDVFNIFLKDSIKVVKSSYILIFTALQILIITK